MAINDDHAWRKVWKNRFLIDSILKERFGWIFDGSNGDVMTRGDSRNPGDYYQCALIGLFRAVKKYDKKKGKFSTYAYPWIYQAISRAFRTHDYKTVRVPSGVFDKLSKLKKKHKLEYEKHMNETAKRDLRSAYSALGDSVRLDAPVSVDSLTGEVPLGELILIDHDGQAIANIDREEKHELLETVLVELTEKERKLIVLRFGLGPEGVVAIREAAKQLGMKKSACQLLEAEALKKMRAVFAQRGISEDILA